MNKRKKIEFIQMVGAGLMGYILTDNFGIKGLLFLMGYISFHIMSLHIDDKKR